MVTRGWLKSVVLCLCILVTVFLYGGFFSHLFLTWQSDPFYAHGPLVGLCSIGLFIMLLWSGRTSELLSLRKNDIELTIVLLVAAGLFYIGGVYTSVKFILGISFLFWGSGLTILFLGKEYFRESLAPFLVLLCVVPLPYLSEITTLLQLGVSTLCKNLLLVLGYPISQEGFNLYFPNAAIQISAECTGVKSWLVLFSLGVFFSYFISIRLKWKVTLVLSIIPIALISNFMRVMLILLLAYHKGQETAMRVWHDYSGMMFYTITCFMIMILGGWIIRYGRSK